MTEQQQPPQGSVSPLILRRSENGQAAGGSFYDKIGGRATLETLVRRFYDGVSTDPVLWPMYPADDLEGAIQRLTMFFEQYWGGPGTYSEQRGHPRLRMRHSGYTINREAREHWLAHMRAALSSLELSPLDDATFWTYLDSAATAMLNTFDE
jgi:hemoglobin